MAVLHCMVKALKFQNLKALKSQTVDARMAADGHCTNCHLIRYMIKVVLNSCGLNEALSKDDYRNQEESPSVRYFLKKTWTEH